jgi:hypothetical protein
MFEKLKLTCGCRGRIPNVGVGSKNRVLKGNPKKFAAVKYDGHVLEAAGIAGLEGEDCQSMDDKERQKVDVGT